MRIDDIAFQRATRVAVFGLALQVVFTLTLLLFGVIGNDTTMINAFSWALVGCPIWLSLVIIFNQHRLERVETLESDELQQQRLAGVGSAFEADSDEFNVAAKRLRWMHKWMMPVVTWLAIVLLVSLAAYRLFYVGYITSEARSETYEYGFELMLPGLRGWALAICLGIAAVSFIFSRFVAGMSKQEAWANLRGGAGVMVGNTLVMLALATGLVFTYFDNFAVMEIVAQAISWFMIVIAIEFFFNFLLNLYRPRRPGEIPRPAFDSRLLSLLSAPDSIVRSINEAINYQVGFDITSSWGYRLFLRAVRTLAVFAIVVLVVLNCIVVVEPHQQGVVLQGGRIVRIEGPGPMFKWPWPIQSAEVHNVDRVRTLPLTVQVQESARMRNEPILWSTELDSSLDIQPFIVSSSRRIDLRGAGGGVVNLPSASELQEAGGAVEALEGVDENFALVEMELELRYRIRDDGLEKFLRFSNGRSVRRGLSPREQSLVGIALREVTRYLLAQDLANVVSQDRSKMTLAMEQRVQEAFDRFNTGVQVLSITNPWIRPAGEAARKFEVLAFNIADREQVITDAMRQRTQQLTQTAGSPRRAIEIYDAIQEYDRMRSNGAPPEELAAQDERIREMLERAGGRASEVLAQAEQDKWTTVLRSAAQLEEYQGRLQAYRTAPRVYREFLLMDVMSLILQGKEKFIVLTDHSRVNVNFEMLRQGESFVFEETLPEGERVEEGVGNQ